MTLASAFAFRVASRAASRAGSVRWKVEALTRLMLWVVLRLTQPSVGAEVDVFVPSVFEASPAASPDVAVPLAASLAAFAFRSLRTKVRFRGGMIVVPRPLPLPAGADADAW